MITNPDGKLHIYFLNVGQADSTVIVSPNGQVIVFDAKNPGKIIDLLKKIGCDKTIEHLVITHPHADHFSGANRLVNEYKIAEATFPPFWHEFGMGPATYRKLVDKLDKNNQTNINFLSGYNRWYPDDVMISGADDTVDPEADPDAPYLELLGPTNGLIRQLEHAKVFNANHLTIMLRLTWKNFRMIVAGDAQMENWGPFDNEKLLEDKCYLLRAAHHGSSNGTQWERLFHLSPTIVVVSSDPEHGHQLPDLGSAAVFTKFDHEVGQYAVITRDAGTIHVIVEPTGAKRVKFYEDLPDKNVDLTKARDLDEITNPTEWVDLLTKRIEAIQATQ